MRIEVGETFVHPSLVEPGWRPDISKGEKYCDGPLARCRIQRVSRRSVTYGYCDDPRPLESLPMEDFAILLYRASGIDQAV